MSDSSLPPLTEDFIAGYRERGYAIIRGVFDMDEIQELADASDQLKAYANQFEATYRIQNQLYVYQRDNSNEKLLRFVRWPAYSFPVFERYRRHPKILAALLPLLGSNIKQINNQVVWKSPGDKRTAYCFHQDAGWRTQEHYRDLGNSYLQTIIAIDPHTPENGCVKVVADSHKFGNHLPPEGSVQTSGFSLAQLSRYGLENHEIVDLILEPEAKLPSVNFLSWHCATILDRLTIGTNSVLGSGAVLTKNLSDNVLAYGNPAKIIRKRMPGDRYLN